MARFSSYRSRSPGLGEQHCFQIPRGPRLRCNVLTGVGQFVRPNVYAQQVFNLSDLFLVKQFEVKAIHDESLR